MRQLLTQIEHISLTNLHARVACVLIIIICVLCAAHAINHRHQRHRVLLSFIAAIIIGFFSWATLEVWWRPFTDHLPFWLYAWISSAAFLVFSAFVQKGRRLILFPVAIIGVLSTFASINFLYNQYPDLAALLGEQTSGQLSYKEFSQLTEPPTADGKNVGAIVNLELPAPISKFHHRNAIAYIPPAYFTDTDTQLPVIVLMNGQPGEPAMWFSGGQLASIMDDYQEAHNGYSPIVISIDATGSLLGNPICVDSAKWKVMTYIAQDIPNSIKEKLRVDEDQSHWTIGGLSYGGTCSLQVITNHPEAYGTFLDISGQAEPTIGTREETVKEFFNGDEEKFIAVNPADLLKAAAGTEKYAQIAGRFIAGTDDKEAVEALTTLNTLAQAANMDTEYQEVPGAHDWTTWRAGFINNLDFMVQRSHLFD